MKAISPDLLALWHQLTDQKTQPVWTAEDRGYREEQFRLPSTDGDRRLRVHRTRDGVLLNIREEPWQMAEAPDPAEEPALYAGLAAALETLPAAAELEALLGNLEATVWLASYPYLEAVYCLGEYEVRLYYPYLQSRQAKPTPLERCVLRRDPACTHVEARLLPYQFTRVDLLSQGFTLAWGAQGVGFGQLAFYQGKDDKPHCSNECMSREFIRQALNKWVDELVLDEERE